MAEGRTQEKGRNRTEAKQHEAIDLETTSTGAGTSVGGPRIDAVIQFGRFRVLLRQRQLIGDGVPIELGTRAFDLLLVLLEADGSLVTKDELLGRVWPGIVVAEENLKTQISALRKALGGDRDFIQTDFGRGYRFTGVARSNPAADRCKHPTRATLRSDRTFLSRECWQSLRCSFGRTN
jgi:DNA-binding winged helix-turn-helix (wHTH) protein